MATKLKAVETSPIAAAIYALDALRNDLLTLVQPDAQIVDLKLSRLGDTPAIVATITLHPFTDATKTVLKLESGMLPGYRVGKVTNALESTSSSRRIVTAWIGEVY